MIPLPADLLAALLFVALATAVTFVAGLRVGRGSLWGSSVAAVLAAGVLVVNGVWLSDNVMLARVLPVADVIMLGNIAGPAAGMLAGVAWARMRVAGGPGWNRWALVVPLLAIGAWRTVEPVVGEAPRVGPAKVTTGVVRQTTLSTCSAAAAATLLRMDGIPSTEAEMARLCLTRTAGTTMLGLYRGLKIKARGSGYDVHVFRGSVEALRGEPLPAVVSVGGTGLRATGLLPLLGLRSAEVGHSVVVVGFVGADRVEIADPFAGLQVWPVERFAEVWRGEGVMLVRK